MRNARVVLTLAIAAGAVLSFTAPDAQGFANPKLARIIFFHLPCAIAATLMLFVGGYYSLRYLRDNSWASDAKSVAAHELCAVLGVLCMVTGILFSKMQWGAWWSWDPRQTSFLMVLLMLSGYFAVRSAMGDDRKRAAVSAAYSAASQLPAVFLIFVYPRLPHVKAMSLHPSTTVSGGGFDRHYSIVIVALTVMMIAIAVWLFRMRVRSSLAELSLEGLHEGSTDRGDTASVGVVRPVPVSAESREAR